MPSSVSLPCPSILSEGETRTYPKSTAVPRVPFQGSRKGVPGSGICHILLWVTRGIKTGSTAFFFLLNVSLEAESASSIGISSCQVAGDGIPANLRAGAVMCVLYWWWRLSRSASADLADLGWCTLWCLNAALRWWCLLSRPLLQLGLERHQTKKVYQRRCEFY